jgi:hypothetical protein
MIGQSKSSDPVTPPDSSQRRHILDFIRWTEQKIKRPIAAERGSSIL